MQHGYRFLAIDVDGTLMNSRNELPAANRAALHRAHEAGLTVCLCTGRTLSETQPVIEEIGLDIDAGVFVFGAVISRLPSGETVSRSTIGEPAASAIVAHFQSREYPVLALYDAAQTGTDYRFVPGRRNAEIFEQWIEMAPARCERLAEWTPTEYDPVRITVVDEPSCIDETLASVRRAFPPDVAKCNSIFAPNYGLHVVECFAPQVDKWRGIMQVADPMGITREQVVAIGDDVNDLEMIREAGLGIAMGNAIEPVKAAAQRQVTSNDACGVAEAIDMILK